MKMAAYVIGDIEVTDPTAFQEYRNRLGATRPLIAIREKAARTQLLIAEGT